MITKHRIQPKREYKKFVRQEIVERFSRIKKTNNTAPVRKSVVPVREEPVVKEEKAEEANINEPVVILLEEKTVQETTDISETEEPIKKTTKKTNRKKKGTETENNE